MDAPLVQTEKKSNKGIVFLYIILFLITGTCSLIFGKLLYQSTAIGLPDQPAHAFQKPWFSNLIMFFGMSFIFFKFEISHCLIMKKSKKDPSVLENITEEQKKPANKVYFMVAAPAACDFFASFIMFVGLLWLPVSIWQMIRGSILIFSGIFRITWLKKPLSKGEWTGLGIIFFAILVVGYANIFGDNDDTSASVGLKILGFILVIVAQAIQAFQTVYEEYLLQGVEASSTMVVGMEGVWGFLFTIVALIAAYFIPGEEGSGLHEDFIDAIYMCIHSPLILTLNILSVVVLLLFNLASMRVTKYTNSVVRNLLEPVRTFFVWIVVVIIHAFAPDFGEGLNEWSVVQLIGFVILTAGILIFNGYINLDYHFSTKKSEPEVVPAEETKEATL